MHSVSFEVRDYELDAQGVVNNGVYFHYFEHARHRWLADQGIDFVALHQQGFDAVVVEATVQYKRSLRSGDRFSVRTTCTKRGKLRYCFEQRLVHNEQDEQCANATVVAAVLHHGKPVALPELDATITS